MKEKSVIPQAPIELEESAQAYANFVQIIKRLRAECPWDRVQTHESMRHLIIEEVYEVVEAIDKKNLEELEKELGDIWVHVLMNAVIANEENNFSITSILEKVSTKLIKRHPHIYGSNQVNSEKEVLENWEKIKQKERGRASVLSGVPRALPSLIQAYRIQEKAANIGFDFPQLEETYEKVKEEIEELGDAIRLKQVENIEAELGDLLFSIVNVARQLNIVPENALRRTNKKFKSRFSYIEKRLSEANKRVNESTLEEMDALWDEAKRLEKYEN